MKHEIITDRLKLKIVEKADAEIIHQLRTNIEVSQFINRDLNKSLTDIENFIIETNEPIYFFR